MLVAACLLSWPATAADDTSDRATLRGIQSMCAVADVIGAPELSSSQLKDQLEAGLAEATIPVDEQASPCVYLKINGLKVMNGRNKPIGLYAISVSIEFFQTVSLVRNPAVKSFAATWSADIVATLPVAQLSRGVQDIATELIRRFVAAYRSANPKA